MKKTPLRTCLICREKFNKRDLLRIVRDKENNKVVFDKSGKMNGRGAYICKNPDCIEKMVNAKIINNSLNMNLTNEDITPLKQEVLKYIK